MYVSVHDFATVTTFEFVIIVMADTIVIIALIIISFNQKR